MNRFKQEFADEQFIDALSSLKGWQQSAMIARHVGCAPSTAIMRMKRLAEAGKIERMQVGDFWVYRSI